MFRLVSIVFALGGWVGCAGQEARLGSGPDGGTPDAAVSARDAGTATSPTDAGLRDGGRVCPPSPLPLANPSEFVLAPEFAETYSTFMLGPLPGAPLDYFVPGVVVSPTDQNTLVFVLPVLGANGDFTAEVRTVPVARDVCGHIVGYAGPSVTASPPTTVPGSVSAFVYGPSQTLLVALLDVGYGLAELVPGASAPSYLQDLTAFGYDASGLTDDVVGLAFVPTPLPGAGGMRLLDMGGNWYHLGYSAVDAGVLDLTSLAQAETLPTTVTFTAAYVPSGSPGFPNQSLLVSDGHVSIYDVDGNGDPIGSTRRPFYSTTYFIPSSMYFEPLTGDFLFTADSLVDGGEAYAFYVVQGFVPPGPE